MATLVWTLAASGAVIGAIASAVVPQGRERVTALFQAQPSAQMAVVAPDAATDGVAAEISRLKNETRLLALEKKALSIRLAMLSEDQGTLTGSIGGQGKADRETVSAPSQPVTGGDAVEVRISDLPLDGDFAEAEELREPAVILSEVAGLPAEVRQAGAFDGRFALEIGSATTIGEARSVWATLRRSAPQASEGLVPLVAMDDRDPGRLWVMAGRFPHDEAAAARCRALENEGARCSVTTRQGRPLPLP